MRRAGALAAALALGLWSSGAAAQTAKVTEGESHIASAFMSGADPGVLAQNVRLGPSLRRDLGDADARKVYDALVERLSGAELKVNALSAADAARYAKLVGSLASPLILVEAGGVALLMQYAEASKHVTFVEQVRGPAPRSEQSVPKPEPPRLAPVLVVPAPAVAVPPPPPAPVVVQKPEAAPKPIAAAPAAPKPAPMKPRGECVVKPVMTEEDLWNCSTPTTPAAMESLGRTPPSPAPAPAAAPAAATKVPAECVITPVMTDDDLRACARR
jgi:hypothetical protein